MCLIIRIQNYIIEMNNTTVWLSLLPNNEENSFCMFHMVNRENNWEFV